MTDCISPPELDDTQLLAYLDGEADAATAYHLAACAHCRERAVALARAQGRWMADLFRVECPPAEDLRDYHFGFLDRGRAAEIRTHLANCPHCVRELAQLAEFVPALDAAEEPGLVERFRVAVARLVQPGLSPIGERGEEGGPPIYRIPAADLPDGFEDDVEVAVSVDPDPDHLDRRTLLGQILGADAAGGRVDLWRGETLIASTGVDDQDSFEFSALEPGAFSLTLTAPGFALSIPALHVE